MSLPPTSSALPAPAVHRAGSDPAAARGIRARAGATIPTVLRRWRTRVRVYLGTERVTAERQALGMTGWRTQRTAVRRMDDEAVPAFTVALDALHGVLADLRTTAEGDSGDDFHQATCSVVIADAWVAYDVVALDLARLSPALADRAVAAALADVVGVPARSLCVRWRPQPDGRSALGVAMAGDALDGLSRVARQHRLRLSSVSGELLAVFAREHERLSSASAVLAVVRPAGIQFAAFAGGAVGAVHFETGRIEPQSLPALARRTLRLHGRRDEDCRCHVDGVEDTAAAPGWDRLPPAPWLAAA